MRLISYYYDRLLQAITSTLFRKKKMGMHSINNGTEQKLKCLKSNKKVTVCSSFGDHFMRFLSSVFQQKYTETGREVYQGTMSLGGDYYSFQ